MKEQTAWADADNARLMELFEIGLTYEQIGGRMGRSKSAIAGQCYRLGLRRVRRSVQETKRLFADKMEAGFGVHEAALAIGVSGQHGYNLLDQLRVDLGWQAR